ncbi:hypothetical protein GCM10011572_36230 [Pseudoduganella buxea]|uniref:Transposase n=1 Tax=Pseudoduganella buxea TaxID=1949069 RepID=A0ABQ1KY50_9BURK|nr:hypothetical protein GCM10011572_36230 [Pseudoduganella buxea]
MTWCIFEDIDRHLAGSGPVMCEGTIVAATSIGAPPSNKTKDLKRGPEMHQSAKGNDISAASRLDELLAFTGQPDLQQGVEALLR